MKNCIKINTKKSKKGLQNASVSYILCLAVALIAMKREVAAHRGRFSVERMSS